MGYAFFGGVAEGLEPSLNKIEQIVDQRVETENNIEAVKQFNDFSVSYEQGLMKDQETYNYDGTFVEAQKVKYNTLKTAFLNNIKNKNTRLKFETLATRGEGDYLSKATQWETGVKQLKTKADALDNEAVSSGFIFNASNAGTLQDGQIELNKQWENLKVSLDGLSAEDRIKTESAMKDRLGQAFISGAEKKILKDFAEARGFMTEAEAMKQLDELSTFIRTQPLGLAPESVSKWLNHIEDLQNTQLNKLGDLAKAAVKQEQEGYLKQLQSGDISRDIQQEERFKAYAKSEDELNDLTKTFDLAGKASEAAIALKQGGNLAFVQDSLVELREQQAVANEEGRFDDAQRITEQIAFMEKASSESMKAILKDPAGEAVKADSYIKQLKDSGDRAGYYDAVNQKFSSLVGRTQVSPLTDTETQAIVKTLLSGSSDEIGAVIQALEAWDFPSRSLAGTSSTPMDIAISKISAEMVKDKNQIEGKTKLNQALALLWYGDDSKIRANLIEYIKTPADTVAGITDSKINEETEKQLGKYFKGFQTQSNLAGGRTNFIAANRGIIRDLAKRIAAKDGITTGTKNESQLVNRAIELTIGRKYATQDKGGNPVAVSKSFATPEYLKFLGDKNIHAEVALDQLYGADAKRGNLWEAVSGQAQGSDMVAPFAKTIKDKALEEVRLEAAKRGIKTDGVDLEKLGVKNFTSDKTMQNTGFLKELENAPLFKGTAKQSKAGWDFKQFSGGYGSAVPEGTVLTEEQANELFSKDIKRFEKEANRIQKRRLDITGKGMSPKQYDALVSALYNLGTDPKATRSLRTAIEQGRDKEASQNFLLYNKAGGNADTGLIARREKESKLYAEGTAELNAVVSLTPEQEKLAAIREEVLNRKYKAEIKNNGVFKPIGNTGTARLYVKYNIPGMAEPKLMPLITGRQGAIAKYLDVRFDEVNKYIPVKTVSSEISPYGAAFKGF
jgi:lysozyme